MYKDFIKMTQIERSEVKNWDWAAIKGNLKRRGQPVGFNPNVSCLSIYLCRGNRKCQTGFDLKLAGKQ